MPACSPGPGPEQWGPGHCRTGTVSSGAWCLYEGQNLHQVPPCPQALAQSPRDPWEAVTVSEVLCTGKWGLQLRVSRWGGGSTRLLSSVSSHHFWVPDLSLLMTGWPQDWDTDTWWGRAGWGHSVYHPSPSPSSPLLRSQL